MRVAAHPDAGQYGCTQTTYFTYKAYESSCVVVAMGPAEASVGSAANAAAVAGAAAAAAAAGSDGGAAETADTVRDTAAS